MRASIVIASLNEGDRLWRTVASCLADIGALDCEIIVADDGSQDGSLDELRHRFPQVPVFVQSERGGPSPTKDLGARHSRGDVLVFLDGHCKPESGAIPRLVADVEQRDLPAPSVRAVIAEVEEASAFGDRLRVEATRLGVSGAGLSVLGDGAEWIGDLVAWHFPLATQVLDVYHGSEQLAQAGRAVFGEGEQLQSWLEAARVQMIGDGYWGVCEVVAALGREPEQAQRLGRSGGEVLNYFCGQRARLGYALRLRRGQAIGSGLVEGTIKQRVNMRMKRSGARWLAQHVGRFVELLAMSESAEWSEFWINMAA